MLNLAADRNARVHAALELHHANAVAVFQGGEPFGVLLSRRGVEPFGGGAVSSADLSASFDLSKAPGLVEGAELEIGGVVHLVSGPVQPDETGWITVTVYPKA